jgi:hypothetical protein
MLGGAIGGGAIAFTLMACYGRPPCPDSNPECYGPPPRPPTAPIANDDAGTKSNSMPFAVPPPSASK